MILPHFYEGENGNYQIATNQEELQTSIKSSSYLKGRYRDKESLKYLKFFEKYGLLYPPKVFKDSNGNYWYYGKSYPLHFLDGQSNGQPVAFLGDFCWNLTEDKKGNLWFAMNKTIHTLEANKLPITSFLSANTFITAIIQDDSNNLWVCAKKGITKFIKQENGFFKREKNWLADNTPKQIRALYIDSKKQLWASATNGLYRLNLSKTQFEYLDYPIIGSMRKRSNSTWKQAFQIQYQSPLQKTMIFGLEGVADFIG
jgi:hypothetical protein